MERFFDLFDERQLAADLFTIDRGHAHRRARARASTAASGAPAARVQERELELPARDAQLPLRRRFVENLIRASLDGEQTIIWPKPLRPILAEALSTLAKLRNVEAAVEDAAEATLILYDIGDEDPEPAAGDARGPRLGRDDGRAARGP